MNYSETLAFLFQKLPLFSRMGAAAYKKDLHNTVALCTALGEPQKAFKTIHVAGTNGKGSVSHMLAACLQAAGYKTGLYTSPHLEDFRERIKINGAMCSKDFVVDFTQRISPLIETLEPSFFEITVAMAFDYFRAESVDIAVIETGLGGRLDSTNVILPQLSIITQIGWDHMNLLGNSLEAIAFEKAGIIKNGVPVVIGETLPETQPIFQAAAVNSPLVFAQHQRYVNDWVWTGKQLDVTVVEVAGNAYQHYCLDLPGYYQTKNLITLLEALHQLRLQGWNLPEKTVQHALKNVRSLTGFHGRWEKLQESPDLVLDVAHNMDGMKLVLEQIELSAYAKVHWVLGMVKDKDIAAVLALLPPGADYYFTQAHIPRALEAGDLMEAALAHGLKGQVYSSVNEAIGAALTLAHPGDLVLVCGSVFLVGEVDRKRFTA
ncbi:MAG: bifunctional folylpolyglutamate synthase/dihydrofolate synthase [Sphingobacteriia bacterium]|nr:MAG: bifunctional folylpolyglutamate synthase/dihydrofolate synthase [Sphingobacteriia bacterium]